MVLQEVIQRYVTAAIAHGRTLDSNDSGLSNKLHDEIIDALHEMQSLGKAREGLLEIINHENPSVRSWAGTHLLKYEPTRAVKTLEELVQIGGIIGFEAEIVLQEWKKGTFRIP